ncbi:asparagine synthase C-terminal domain-containing protein [Halorhabdus sp. CUG00001]|uniref:asparagine synthase C-terminal domain-containing protein n=1 Tax=Halorhabdus sp. CUG00001 TaxID=2600297 RepID=UPI00131DE99A|nr:asparagine synthase-related protein [Halorhabdus sp. CUG00001]
MGSNADATSTGPLVGADPEPIRAAIEDENPLSGTRGFAGRVDGSLVRDVLGRYPLFLDGDGQDRWAFDPTELADPTPLPAGQVVDPAGNRREVWSLPDPSPRDGTAAVRAVGNAIDDALADVDTDGLAIAFSGGVDSALLAARLEAPLYVAGFPNSHDVRAARETARLLDREVRVVELDHDALVEAVPPVATATGRTNAMAVEIALPLYLVAKRAAADGFDRLAVGQGADELFGGYAKVARAPEDPRVAAETVRGARREVLESLPDQLTRDVLAIRAGGVEPVAPLLADGVVEAGLALPGSLLVTDRGERKYALRLAARKWLPDPVAFREKKALQYGSLVARELDRVARQAGFKRRMDDHVTQYVESLLE